MISCFLLGGVGAECEVIFSMCFGAERSKYLQRRGNMKNRIKQIALALGMIAATLSAQAGTFKLPEFLNAQQLTAWRAQHAAPATTVARASDEQAQFFTGKPYDAASGTYQFKYRAYNPAIARWTSADPGGFPDGANNQIYAACPTSGLDYDGCKVVPLGNLTANTDVDIISGGIKIGSVHVDSFRPVPLNGMAAADIYLTPNITANTGKYYQWRQHYTAKDGAGNILTWNNIVANDALDNGRQTDKTIEWYWESAVWNSILRRGPACDFWDHPRIPITDPTMTIIATFRLDLVEVDNLNVKDGGNSLITLNWGFKYSE